MTTITRIYEFAAAHSLWEHPGKCQQIHGHNYKVEVTVEKGPWFEELDEVVNPIIEKLDHTFLDDMPTMKSPTAEHIAEYVFEHGDFLKVKVWENDRSFAEVTH